MLDLEELEQFIAFKKYGTLSKVAETFNISQPSITRNMKKIEEDFGVTLFERGKNHISLNETGELAVECAEKVLQEAENAISKVQNFDKRQRTIVIESCAPAPLWSLLPELGKKYPDKTFSSATCDIEQIIRDVREGNCDLGVLPYEYKEKNLQCIPYIEENLAVCVRTDHELAGYEEVSFEQINGFNCLVREEIGFWSGLCKEKMPASRFLVQTDEFELEELIRTSTLLCFTTNLADWPEELMENRKAIPIIDNEANVRYYVIKKKAE